MPLVSVIIPTYNRSRLVVEAIGSVLGQTIRDIEVLVVDDGSTDDTCAVIKAIDDSRICYLYKENSGVSAARNLGLKRAVGKYICFLDSDDLWPANFLEVMVGTLEENYDYGAAYCARTLLYPDGTRIESYESEYCRSGRLTEALFEKSFMQTSSLCFRRDVLEGFYFNESLKNSEDRDAWLRLATKTKFLFVPSVQIIYREQHGVSPIDYSSANYNRILVLERFYFKLGGDKFVSAKAAKRKFGHVYRSLAKEHLRKRARIAAIYLFKRAIQYRPSDLKLYIELVRSILLSKKNDAMPDWKLPVLSDIPHKEQLPKLITNIVFTKNRPLQLDAYLASLYTHFSQKDIQTYIFYKAELFDAEYNSVFKDFPDCIVIREMNFHDDFLKLLESINTEYILFGTDDVLYYDSVSMKIIDEMFRKFPNDIFGFSLRLSPDAFQESGDTVTELDVKGEKVWKINWKKAANHTACYPFELNSTIYRTELVKKIVSHIACERLLLKRIFRKDALRVRLLKSIISMKNFLISLETFGKPNTLEGYACRWCKKHRKKVPNFLYFQKLCASAIQVNIVNTEIDNAIFGGREHTVEALNEKFKQGYRFDIDFLVKNKPRQTHVGKESFRLK